MTMDLSYRRIFWRFLRFGFLAWGGPVAQIGMIRRELVEEGKWISRERFNRVLAVYQVLPGPEAHELCVYFGMLARGRIGGLLAGLGFMLPGFLLMFALSWFYVRHGVQSPFFSGVFYGMQAAVPALILRATHRIGEHALTKPWHWLVAVAVFLFALSPLKMALPFFPQGAENPSLMDLFSSGLRAGLLTFGGAYTVIPFLQYDAVVAGHWMTNRQFLDGLALSGILPAPFIIFATFVGYLGGGPWGGLVLTAGIFLPAFAFTLIGHHYIEKLISNQSLHAFLDGVTAGVVGLIAATTLGLLKTAVVDIPSFIILAAALIALYRWRSKATVAVVILGAGLAGIFLKGLM